MLLSLKMTMGHWRQGCLWGKSLTSGRLVSPGQRSVTVIAIMASQNPRVLGCRGRGMIHV